MWIVASLPLWLIGFIALGLGLLGIYVTLTDKSAHTSQYAGGTFIALSVAAVFLALAAKVAS